MDKLKLYYVTWLDSQHVVSTWICNRDIQDNLPLIYSVGYAVRDNEKELMLVGCVTEDILNNPNDIDANFSRIIRIPVCQIKSKVEILIDTPTKL